jgi:hypothetical protein
MDPLEDLKNMMGSIVAQTMIQQGMDSYDRYAVNAMRALIENRIPGETPDQIAEQAWLFADAMLAERQKRGLGGVARST